MITGGIKFFDFNYAWLDNGGTIAVSSGSVVENNAIDKNPLSYWTSVASDDTTTETLTLTFPSSTFNRILLIDHNFKQYTVKYWNGSSFVNFSGVLGLDPTGVNGNGVSMSNISETIFADPSSYYEFNSVTTNQIQIAVLKSQVVNAQKFINQIIVTTELGTFVGFPTIKPTVQRNQRDMTMLSGRHKIVKSNQSVYFTISMSPYAAGTSYAGDSDLMLAMLDRDTPFLIWPCGARRGSNYFKYQNLRGFRLVDIFYVQVNTDYTLGFNQNLYTGLLEFDDIVLQEVV